MHPPDADAPAPVRIGVLCRGTTVRAWQDEVLRALEALPAVEVALLVVDARRPPTRRPIDRVTRLARSPHTVWDAFNNGWVGRTAASLRPVDRSAVWAEVPRLDVVPEVRGMRERFPADAVEAIRAARLDLLLRFAFGIIDGPILESARWGVWSFHHDDEELYRGSPPAYWEIVDGNPVTGAILQRLTDRLDGGHVLARGWFPTVAHSYTRNTDAVHLGATAWPAQVVERLRRDGDASLHAPSRSTAPVLRKPGNADATRFLVGQARRFAASQARGVLLADHWDLGVVRAPIHRFLDPTFEPRVEWQRVGTPGRCYAADPFVVHDDEGALVLYERFDSRRRIGEIWQVRPGRPGSARPAGLPVQAHASYPFTVEDEGRTCCLPQVAADGVPLFERVGGTWHRVADLLPGERVLDPTVVRWDDRWWLFGTRPGRGSLTTLELWHAPSLLGPWRPHPASPVKTDVRSARPAGTPFVHEGRLYRPAQDGSSGYGSAVAICEVTRLDDTGFDERVVRVVRPAPWWPLHQGVHTLSAAGQLTLLDARRDVLDRHETAAELRARLARVRR